MSQQMPQDFSPFQQAAPPPPARRRSGAVAVVAVLVLILAVSVIVNETLLRIKKVAVVGIDKVTWAEVIVAAGLDKPVTYFAVNETKIAQGIETNRYLVYERLEKQFPDLLTIYVRERKSIVVVQEMSVNYFLDAEGMVLERSAKPRQNKDENDLSEEEREYLLLLENMVVVTGLKPKELRVGRMMTAGTVNHLNAYRAVLDELLQQGCLNEIGELNLSDPDNIYLVTRDGYTAHLGDLTELRAKIGTVRAVVAALREMGQTGGMLEAAIPAEVIYSPES